MIDHIMYGLERPVNIKNLSIVPHEEGWECEKNASGASERFLCSAMLLEKEGFLGCCLKAEGNKKFSAFAFSGPGVKLSEEDYNWIFSGCAKADPRASSEMEDPNAVKRKNYLLSPAPDISENTGTAGMDEFGYDVEVPGMTSADYFTEMFHMLSEAGALIRIIAGAADKGAAGHGMIMISLPEEMPLRMRTIVSLAIPHTAVKDMDADMEGQPESGKRFRSFADAYFLEYMTQFLCRLICQEEPAAENADPGSCTEGSDAAGKGSDAETGSENSDPVSDMTIEDLDLSIRSYNCLKRAGISSVETLRSMSDEDLGHVRNMGKKSIAEIRRKLLELRERGMAAPSGQIRKMKYLDQLDQLIGLDDVKEQVRKITSFARMKKDMKTRGMDTMPIALNMEFVGNPGTAKTTVARIAAGIFHEIGLLSSPDLVEVGRADLVARYTGQTADQVKDIFRLASGRMLLIDEAYSLVDAWENSFGDEAIATIVQEMENHREDTIVVFAGYPDKMAAFFSRNPGLRSRVPFSITFRDYSAEDMVRIVEFEAGKRGFSIDHQAMDKVLSICEAAAGKAEAGNGRFCRNLVEKAILGYASRVYAGTDTAVSHDFVLAPQDFRVPGPVKEEKKHNPIGFAA